MEHNATNLRVPVGEGQGEGRTLAYCITDDEEGLLVEVLVTPTPVTLVTTSF